MTSLVSIPSGSKINANSLINAILTSLWVFSITLDASATLMLEDRKVPAVIMDLYKLSTRSAMSSVDPEVTFKIFVTVCSLSPGLMRSGEKPAKKQY